MIFDKLIYPQPENIKKLIRKIENLEKKLANARSAILFNKTCLNENILSKFTNIYIYTVNLLIGLPWIIYFRFYRQFLFPICENL